jgi:polynucleotide kinase-phosphatase
MSPTETSQAAGLLEHPAEAFAHYRHAGVPKVVCEEKHMGSRAVVIACRDEQAALKAFGVRNEGLGICYTRTGRKFFDDVTLERTFLETVSNALGAAGFWEEFKTDWICLDCELMPWSAKAQELLKQQYAAVGAAAQSSLAEEIATLDRAVARGMNLQELRLRVQTRCQTVNDYVAAYRRYCWPVGDLNDLKLAPFHVLATEGHVHTDKPHEWHMQTIRRLCDASRTVYDGYDDLFLATPFRVVDVTTPESEAEGIRWWEDLTNRGGEGMVVKPSEFIVKGRKGLVQPAIKCRGREYLRIIYGPEYTLPENLERLRARGLSTKRSLALREFALGIESLERFVRKEPLRRVHEAVFGVLALESEPVDPRL